MKNRSAGIVISIVIGHHIISGVYYGSLSHQWPMAYGIIRFSLIHIRFFTKMVVYYHHRIISRFFGRNILSWPAFQDVVR